MAAQATAVPTEPQLSGESLQPGNKVGRYVIVRSIGRGGMGAVYEAHDTRLDRKVALKTLVGSLVGRPEAAKRFAIEAQAAARLAHPNVVAIHDCDTDNVIPYMAMELLQGEPLSSRIRRGPLSTEQIADALLGVCAGVQAAHYAGIVHRDLKPSNIFLSTDWDGQVRARVLDFGISKIKDISSGGLTETGDILGTSQYLSPEQASGDLNVDGRSDQYSLGVVMYEAVTQRTPHQGEPMYSLIRNVVEGRWQPPKAFVPSLDPTFEAIILRAMCLKPADRFPSVFDLGKALFPFSSPKVQRAYADYYLHADPASSRPEVKPAPTTVLADVPLATAALAEPAPKDWQLQSTHTSLPPSGHGGLPGAILTVPGSEGPSSAQFIARQSSRRLIILMGVGAVAILLSLALALGLMRSPPVADSNRGQPIANPTETPSISPPPSAEPLPKESAKALPPVEVKPPPVPALDKPQKTEPAEVEAGSSSKESVKVRGKARKRFTPSGHPIL